MKRPRAGPMAALACAFVVTLAVLMARSRNPTSTHEIDLAVPPSVDALVEDSRLSAKSEPASLRSNVVGGEEAVQVETLSPVSSVDAAQKQLSNHALAALDGVIYINEVLDDLIEFAALPVGQFPDLDYEDDDALAYKLTSAPAGTDARVLIGLQPYFENGRAYRYLQMEVDIGEPKAEFVRDSMRDRPNVSLSVSYDMENKEVPTRLAVLLQRRVNLASSKDTGIDA